MTLIAETGKSDFSNFDVASYQAKKAAADLMISRIVADPLKSNVILPAAASAEYQKILKETGLNDLSAADYSSYLSAKHVSNLALSTLQGSEADDVIVANPADNKNIFVLGQGNDVVSATESPDILIGGAGNDMLDGGKGLDKAVFSGDSKS
jgi:Ca2+-binding RTX toxin-like protein